MTKFSFNTNWYVRTLFDLRYVEYSAGKYIGNLYDFVSVADLRFASSTK